MIDMTQNRVTYSLLTAEEKAALLQHAMSGGEILVYTTALCWFKKQHNTDWYDFVYRTVPVPLTQDEIDWGRLPAWAEWVAREDDGTIFCYSSEPAYDVCEWYISSFNKYCQIDDFPGIVLKLGTCDWKGSKQRRPECQ